MRYVVTTGKKFTDIDGYACCIAYADLLRKDGKEAIAVLPGVLNESVVEQVRTWQVSYQTVYSPSNEDVFVLLDISNPDYFPEFVDFERIVEIIDHHFGYESIWRPKLGNHATIEKIGATATLIFERARQLRLLEKLEPESQKLLYTAIFANSLNLHASNTNMRDKRAVSVLGSLTGFSSNWHQEYFQTMQQQISEKPYNALNNDFKRQSIFGEVWAIGQIELWDGGEFILKFNDLLKKYLLELPENLSFIIVPSIKEGRTYVISKNLDTQNRLERLGLAPDGVLDSLRLRIEWVKLLLEDS